MAIISVLLVTNDVEYSHRLRRYIGENHSDIKLTILNNAENLKRMISEVSFSVILIGDEFIKFLPELPAGMVCGILFPRDMGGEINGHRCFCKYRSGETLYSIILELYSEISTEQKTEKNGASMYVFASANGGAGSTLVSAAAAVRLAVSGKRTLYFSFDRYCMPSLLFNGEVRAGMSDFIFSVLAAEKRNSNLSLKATSLLAKDSTGVKYMDGCKNAVDMDELSTEQLSKAFGALISSDEYEAVVVDIPLLDRNAWETALKHSCRVFAVTESGSIPKQKLERLVESVRIIDARRGTELLSRFSVVINKDLQRREGAGEQLCGVPVAGYIPRYRDSDLRAVVNAISRLNMWNDCL